MRTASAYSPSVGKNMIAKSVVRGGFMYLSLMVFAQFLSVSVSVFLAFSMVSGSPVSYASINP